MSAVITRRREQGGTVWFEVEVADAELVQPASRLLMDYERTGDQWRRGYPAGTAHLEAAWLNFARDIEQIVRQAARLEPVPWQAALRELCVRTDGTPAGWWLTGSAALAVRGAPIEPGDLDLVCTGTQAQALGDVFSDAVIEPVRRADDEESISRWWGRAFCGARIEWIGDPRPFVDDPHPSDFGLIAARQLETVPFEHWQLKVPPLHLQRAVNERRGLASRVELIDELAGP